MKKLKEKMLKANKNFKLEIRNLVIINVLTLIGGITLIILTKNLLNLAYLFGILVLINFYYLTRYSRIIAKNNNNLVLDFIDTFSYFRIYISNNMNVYQAFKQIQNYTTPYIKGLINKLLSDIDDDKSLKPYITFASNFNNDKVEEVMIAIYEMVNEGNNETYINQFVSIFTTFKERIIKNNEIKRENRFTMINQCSLIGSGVLMIAIMLGIVNLLGEYIA